MDDFVPSPHFFGPMVSFFSKAKYDEVQHDPALLPWYQYLEYYSILFNGLFM